MKNARNSATSTGRGDVVNSGVQQPLNSTTGAAALDYARRGWLVFPAHSIRNGSCTCGNPHCDRPGKHPATAHGLKDATTDPDQIRAWWQERPWLNVATVTGRESGLVVIDVDVGPDKHGAATLAALEAEHGPMPVTVSARTGSGGRHLLFQRPDTPNKIKNGTNVLGAHIDVRADDGYIIAPPSENDKGPYAFINPPDTTPLAPLPDWIRRKIEVQPKPKPTASPRPQQPSGADDLRAALFTLSPDCDHSQWVQVGMALHATGRADAFTLWDFWSAGSAKYPGADAMRRRWDSFQPGGGITEATIYGLARAGGWRPPKPPADRGQRGQAAQAPTDPAPTEAAPAAWPAVISLDTHTPKPMPDTILTGWLGAMVRAVAMATETPIELPVGFALAVVATAVQGVYRIAVEPGYFEPLNVWTCQALEPGNRKTAVIGPLSRPLMDWEQEQRKQLQPDIEQTESDNETVKARVAALRAKAAKTDESAGFDKLKEEIANLERTVQEPPKPRRLWGQDITPEQSGVVMGENDERFTLLSDEGGLFDTLGGRYSNGIPNLDLFLQAHAGGAVRVDRGSRPPIFMRSPALTIGLSPQPDVLRGLSSKPGFRGRGLLARFLYLLPTSPLGYRTHQTTPVPGPVAVAYAAALAALLNRPQETDDEGNLQPFVLLLSDEARAEWKAFQRITETRMRDGGRFEHIRDWAAKLPGAAARLAGILHCAEYAHGAPEQTLVSLATMEQALELAALFSDHALAVFDLMGADPAIDGARKVWRWVLRNRQPNFTARDCWKALQGSFPKRSDIDPAFSILMERGYLRELPSEMTSAGRPSLRFEVNPQLTGEWS